MPPETPAKSSSHGSVRDLPLSELRFDLRNPRYGPDAPNQQEDKEALNYILSRFDMSDVLSSISVNGFFDSEPLVGVEEANGTIRILEGNRRLAACLVLAGDDRAVSQKKKKDAYPLREGISLETIPVMVYTAATAAKDLLPYLGVRHIVGGRPWDSYAKAHWVAQTLAAPENELTLADIKAMLGDSKGLTERLLTAYQVIQQLKANNLFDPEDSVRRGRGSAAFPFSLIYNALDDRSLRKWLDMPEGDLAIQKDPIPTAHLKDASSVVKLICGSLKEGFAPAINDSREIRALSQAVQNAETFAQLMQGAAVKDVEREIMAPSQRVLENLVAATPPLEDTNNVLTKAPLSKIDAKRIHPTAVKVARLAVSISKELKSQIGDDDEF